MIIGLSISTFITVHVVISLIAIASGLVVLFAMLRADAAPSWTALFLATTVATTVTGFMFPITAFTPALGTGIVSSVVLAVALYALYARHLAGVARSLYVVTAIAALYLNSFVLVVQSFQKLGPLQALAPTQSEPPFLAAQGAVLIFYVVAGWLAVRRFHPAAATQMQRA
jgi:hypothetical protein